MLRVWTALILISSAAFDCWGTGEQVTIVVLLSFHQLGQQHNFAPIPFHTFTHNNDNGAGGVAIVKEDSARCKEGLLRKQRYFRIDRI